MGSLFACCFSPSADAEADRAPAPAPSKVSHHQLADEKHKQEKAKEEKTKQGSEQSAQRQEEENDHQGQQQQQQQEQVQALEQKAQDTDKQSVATGKSEQGDKDGHAKDLEPARRFRFKELEIATDNFHDSLILGEGGFGKVYQGRVDSLPEVEGSLPGGMNVAIKKLNPESIQGYEQWVNEVLILDRLHHPNLVRLIGYCAEENEALLVYTLYPRGSLDKVLFEDAGPVAPTPAGERVLAAGLSEPLDPTVLPWDRRVRVALDAARGLAYLHSSSVIHRDFKPSNILLASTLEPAAVLTDFGMARTGPDTMDTHISTRIMGTLGYLDPLYLETGRLTYKSDTFAFGVMLLELLTGKREGTERKLSTWVRQWDQQQGQDDIVLHVDWRLKGTYPRTGATRLALLALKCVSIDQEDRPEMAAVVEELVAIRG